MRLCEFNSCGRPVRALGLCIAHDKQNKRGVPLKPLRDYFQSMSEADVVEWILDGGYALEGDCWVWTRAGRRINSDGCEYPTVRIGDRVVRASRLVAKHLLSDGKDLTEGHVVHHRCARTMCVRPAHLQIVTEEANIAEMMQRRVYENRIAELEALLSLQAGLGS